jgi:hypothetical protein
MTDRPHILPQSVVDEALATSDAGLSDRANAELHGVAITTIRRWRREYQRQGRPRGQAHTSALCPRCDAGPLDVEAYAELLGWYLFPQHGPGRKHERPIVLEPWQQAIVDAHPGPLLRGLFHSDGCRVTNWTVRPLRDGPKRYEYPRYLFSNESTDILAICTDALDAIGARWTAPRRNVVSVARRESVARLDQIVGPKS